MSTSIGIEGGKIILGGNKYTFKNAKKTKEIYNSLKQKHGIDEKVFEDIFRQIVQLESKGKKYNLEEIITKVVDTLPIKQRNKLFNMIKEQVNLFPLLLISPGNDSINTAPPMDFKSPFSIDLPASLYIGVGIIFCIFAIVKLIEKNNYDNTKNKDYRE